MADAEVEGTGGSHRKPADVRLLDTETFQELIEVLHRDVLTVGFQVLRNVRWRITAGVVCDDAVAAGKEVDLSLPALHAATKLVAEDQRVTFARFGILKLDTVGFDSRHRFASQKVTSWVEYRRAGGKPAPG